MQYLMSHSLRGSVDWNIYWGGLRLSVLVTPYAGVWIEIKQIDVLPEFCYVTPYAGVWIEIHNFVIYVVQ